jgi:hypothetical protein
MAATTTATNVAHVIDLYPIIVISF